MSDVDVIARILIDALDAGPAHARIVARDIAEKLLGADAVDEPLEAEIVDGCCATCGQAVPEYAGIVLDRDRHEVRYGGKRVGSLTGKEFTMLDALYKARGRTVSKEAAMNFLYDLTRSSGEEVEIKIIDVFVCKLRKKIEPIGLVIGTAWGRGYYLADPAKKEEAA